MAGIADLFRNPGGGSDPGIYAPEEFYQPDDGQGRRVPQNWGDIIGGFLGQISNVARARRNQEARGLQTRWDSIDKSDPSAVKDFLDHAPSWFVNGVLGGAKPEDFRSQSQKAQRDTATKFHQSVQNIFTEAKDYADPTQRDQFIETRLNELRDEYPPDLVDALINVLRQQRAANGHYPAPGQKSATDTSDLTQRAETILQNAAKYPDPDAYVKEQIARIQQERQEQGLPPLTQQQIDSLFPKDAKGSFSRPDVGLADADIKRTWEQQHPGQPVPSILGEWLAASGQDLSAQIAQLSPADQMVIKSLLNTPLSQVWNMTSHAPDQSKIVDVEDAIATRADRNKAAKPDITALKLQFESLRAREMNIRTTIRDLSDVVKSATPEGKAQLDAAKAELAKVLQQENQVLQSIADANSTQTQGSAAPGASPAGSGSSAPTTQTPAQQFQAALKTKPRADVLRSLAASAWWKGLDQQARIKFANEVGITKRELQWMAGSAQGNPPANTPAAQPGARQEPVDPTVAEILKQMQHPSALSQIGSAIAGLVSRIGKAGAGSLPPFDVQNPTIRHDVLLLLKVWPRLNAQQREQIRNAKGLSEQQAQWLTQHAGQPAPAGRH